MINKNIRMAILDDGVHPEACPLAGSYLISNDLSVVEIKKNTVSPYSHGSMCARILQRYAKLNHVDIFSIQILQKDTLHGNIERLLKALELCASMDIRLVHLSVGTYAYEDFAKLEEAVRRLLDSDRFLVAAAGNRGTVTYPAYLPGVIGVKCNQKLRGGEYAYCNDPFTRIHFQASARHKLSIEGREMETSTSNSYAAPLVTAKLLSCIKEHGCLKKQEVVRLLIENALHTENAMSTGNALYTEHAIRGASAANRVLYPPVEIPVVVLSGFSVERLSHLVALFTDRLCRDDYHVRVATNLSGIRPWDETALPKAEDLEEFVSRMAWYFSCEIILLGSTSYIPPDRCGNASLWIYGGESGDVQAIWAAGMEDGQVYETMIELLT